MARPPAGRRRGCLAAATPHAARASPEPLAERQPQVRVRAAAAALVPPRQGSHNLHLQTANMPCMWEQPAVTTTKLCQCCTALDATRRAAPVCAVDIQHFAQHRNRMQNILAWSEAQQACAAGHSSYLMPARQRPRHLCRRPMRLRAQRRHQRQTWRHALGEDPSLVQPPCATLPAGADAGLGGRHLGDEYTQVTHMKASAKVFHVCPRMLPGQGGKRSGMHCPDLSGRLCTRPLMAATTANATQEQSSCPALHCAPLR